MAAEQTRKGIIAGILIGIGMGGFVDGIVLHQILQWHNMISNVLPPETVENMSINMVWDGIFHAFDWTMTLIGVFLLWSAAYHRNPIPSLKQFVGTLILGMGIFNLVEGIIDHHILALHYVRQVPNYDLYNFSFLAIGGVLFILIGWLLMRPEKVTATE
ncbi:MAG TPA: DUF2243 domain-containing protein [Leptolyngbyaceae cyanobacterium]